MTTPKSIIVYEEFTMCLVPSSLLYVCVCVCVCAIKTILQVGILISSNFSDKESVAGR